MRGRVTSLQFAVTVVGFTTVRTMATVALTGMDDESRLPEDFWDLTTAIALAASTLAPRFGERPQDALCTGLLSQLGMALLAGSDPDGHAALRAARPSFAELRAAEVGRYGISALRLTGVALEQWGFPREMITAVTTAEELTAPEGALLRAAFEVGGRLTWDHHAPVPVERLTAGVVSEQALAPVLEKARAEAEGLRRAVLG
jgi:HD-like signal output (HDOD) protein